MPSIAIAYRGYAQSRAPGYLVDAIFSILAATAGAL